MHRSQVLPAASAARLAVRIAGEVDPRKTQRGIYRSGPVDIEDKFGNQTPAAADALIHSIANDRTLRALTIDTYDRRMYWADASANQSSSDGAIYRASLDGRNVEPLVAGLHDVDDVAVAGRMLFWREGNSIKNLRMEINPRTGTFGPPRILIEGVANQPSGHGVGNERIALDPFARAAAGAVTYQLVESNTALKATFVPNDGITLEKAAELAGVDHFNWRQRIVNATTPGYHRERWEQVPGFLEYESRPGNRTAILIFPDVGERFDANGEPEYFVKYGPGSGTTVSGRTRLDVPFIDPGLNRRFVPTVFDPDRRTFYGNYENMEIWVPDSGPPNSESPNDLKFHEYELLGRARPVADPWTDSYDGYWDEVLVPGDEASPETYNRQGPYISDFHDKPATRPGWELEFETELVGVRTDGQGNNEYISWDGLDTKFRWKSNVHFVDGVYVDGKVEFITWLGQPRPDGLEPYLAGSIFDIRYESEFAVVPEPTSFLLALVAVASMTGFRHRRSVRLARLA